MAVVKAVKKPVEIEAIQFVDTYSAREIVEWVFLNQRKENPNRAQIEWEYQTREAERIWIATLEGRMYATPGDWVIRGVRGEFYPCKPDIFDETYDIKEN